MSEAQAKSMYASPAARGPIGRVVIAKIEAILEVPTGQWWLREDNLKLHL